jgi:fluoroacetyl-CoA thioesterase
MKPVAVGQSLRLRIETNDSHTADHYGNKGVAVIATPVLIGFLETAANECLLPSYEPGEGSVGIHVNVRHLAAALPGAVVEVSAVVTAVKGRQVEFAVEARGAGETLLMAGSHGRAVVNLTKFLGRLGVKPPEGV